MSEMYSIYVLFLKLVHLIRSNFIPNFTINILELTILWVSHDAQRDSIN